MKKRERRLQGGHLDEVFGRAVHGQGVIEIIGGVELSAAGRVGERLVGLLDGLELLLDGQLCDLVRAGRPCLVRVMLQS